MNDPLPSLSTLPLSKTHTLLSTARITSHQLTKTYLTRIDEVNRTYNAVIETNPHALEDAHRADLERKNSPSSFGPLHGIPILLKDNIVTKAGSGEHDMQATSGSFALEGAKPEREAAVVTRLRERGAVVLGKANMAEWCGFRSTSGCSGWSARGGQAKGIYHKDMKASGSSTGSAIATALGLCCAAIGTETCYSIVSPAEKSGIVGFKPTRGLIETDGIIFSSHSQDTVGVLTRTVQDAEELVSLLGSNESMLGCESQLLGGPGSPYFGRIRIGIPRYIAEVAFLSGPKRVAFLNALGVLKRLGAELESVDFEGAEAYDALSTEEGQIVLDTDMKIALNTYLETLQTNPNNIRTLDDIIAFTKAHPEEEYPARNVAVLERANATDPEDQMYKSMLEKDKFFAGKGGIPGALEKYNVDVILVPSLSVMMSTFVAKAGSPALSLPMGMYPANTKVKLDPRNGMVDIGPGIPSVFPLCGFLPIVL
ncbi:unnamed protein product [Periconia digitata]|uniref:Amidase domain-containing protein n=1 Tax=Periconia digitata TaxID=1303443 RepID=A0A9W4UIU8_9PLEO|nr:unnamed protein product [Periconia digitata]